LLLEAINVALVGLPYKYGRRVRQSKSSQKKMRKSISLPHPCCLKPLGLRQMVFTASWLFHAHNKRIITSEDAGSGFNLSWEV